MYSAKCGGWNLDSVVFAHVVLRKVAIGAHSAAQQSAAQRFRKRAWRGFAARLRTDTSIFQARPDPLVSIEETAGTLRELTKQGKIRLSA